MRIAALTKQARLQQEAAAVTCMFMGLVLLLSLISYSLPLLGAPAQLQQPAENWCGHFGYYAARYLLSFFGLPAFFSALLFFQLAAAVLTARARAAASLSDAAARGRRGRWQARSRALRRAGVL